MLQIIRWRDVNLFATGLMHDYREGYVQQFILLTLISCTY